MGVSRGRRNRYHGEFGLDRTRSFAPTDDVESVPSHPRTPKQSYESRMDHISGFYAAHEPAAQPFKREPSWAIDRGLESSRPQELSSRMRSDTRQTRAPVFHKQAQALAFPFLSLKEEVYKVLLTQRK